MQIVMRKDAEQIKKAIKYVDEVAQYNFKLGDTSRALQYVQFGAWLRELKGGDNMDKINWKRKLTSRKLWLSVAGFVSLIIVAMGGTENEAAQVASIIMAGATVVAYIVGEGLADGMNSSANVEAGIEVEEEK